METARVCSECGISLAGRPAKQITCSGTCRNKRSKRMRREAKEFALLPPDSAEAKRLALAQANVYARVQATDIARDVLKKEITPIVREALTEDVLGAINKLVGLTPRMVEAIAEDLESEDTLLRQKAYSLLMRYTVGHTALVKPEEDTGGSQMVVNFNLPRPDAEPQVEDVIDAPLELVVCDMCQTEKPTTEMVAGSNRCQACFDEWKANVLKEFAA